MAQHPEAKCSMGRAAICRLLRKKLSGGAVHPKPGANVAASGHQQQAKGKIISEGQNENSPLRFTGQVPASRRGLFTLISSHLRKKRRTFVRRFSLCIFSSTHFGTGQHYRCRRKCSHNKVYPIRNNLVLFHICTGKCIYTGTFSVICQNLPIISGRTI